MSHCLFHALGVTLALSSLAHAEMRLTSVSPRVGHVFVDNEPVDFSVQVAGAPGPVTLEYRVTETEGPFTTQGKLQLPIANEIARAPLPLKLPNRGRYEVALTATSAGQSVKTTTAIGIVFPPAKPDPASPWGVCFTPPVWWGRQDHAKAAAEAADSLRLLGASWVRQGFGSYSFGEIKIARRDGKPYVTCNPVLDRIYINALRKSGLSIMCTIGSMPTVLSSRPTETSTVRDAGELRNRVKPRDYAEWDSLIANLTADFRNDISAWEIENEPNQPDLGYWSGTPEELLEFVAHTSKAIKAGNPDAQVIGCGFVHVNELADKLFAQGITKHLDILSVHYVNDFAEIQQWDALRKKYKIIIPVWCSEESAEIPTIDLANGVQRSFIFMHVGLPGPAGEGAYHGLCNTDFTVRPTGIWFSVGAHCIGTAKAVESFRLGDDYFAVRFVRGEESILVLSRQKEKTSLDTVTLAAKPLDPKKPITLTDRFGRSQDLPLTNGKATIRLQNRHTLFINGAKSLTLIPSH